MKKRVLALVMATLLVANQVSAGPGEVAWLARIVAAMEKVRGTLSDINEVLDAARETVNDAFPNEALQELGYVMKQVRSIKEEVTTATCSWSRSLRVTRIDDGLFKGTRLCRPQFVDLYGESPKGILDSDLEEYRSQRAVTRMNMVASRVEASQEQAKFIVWLQEEAKRGRPKWEKGPESPGYSQRLSAMGAATLVDILRQTGDTQTELLSLRQEQANAKRRERFLQQDASLVLLEALSGGPR